MFEIFSCTKILAPAILATVQGRCLDMSHTETQFGHARLDSDSAQDANRLVCASAAWAFDDRVN